jgi:IS605 OrfB family transposase
VKPTNQFYHKRSAELQAALGHPGTTMRMARLMTRRTRCIKEYPHEASRAILALLVAEGCGTLVEGKNPGWKQEAALGRMNNQHFAQIPRASFIGMLEYKTRLAGINFVLREERYTSRASYLDVDSIPAYDPKRDDKPVFSSKRVKRGLYRAKDGRTMNAEVNGSYDILRKAVPDAFGKGVEALEVAPGWLTPGPDGLTQGVDGSVNRTNRSLIRQRLELCSGNGMYR